MRCLTSLLLLAAATAPALAQDGYWIANRASSDIMKISAWGSVLQRIAMPSTLRSAHTAPDGKVWVVRFGQPTVDIVDPATATITQVASTLGSPYEIAFDAAGDAWVCGGTGVQHFTAAGVLVQAYPLTATAPLGITIDSSGNKWIAHRATPASVSRIDPTGVVTNFPLTGATTLPVKIIADYRGLFTPSHIWVTGDGTAQLVELDEQGTVLNVYATPLAAESAATFDKNGRIWVCSTAASNNLLQIDQTNGSVLATYTNPNGAISVSTDSFGRILATARVTFSGVGPPCEVRRWNPTTGDLEVPALLQSGAFNAAGTQTAASTPFQYSLVVNPLGDLDGDGEPNYAEVLAGTSPIDRWSSSVYSVNTTGISSIGNAPSFDSQAAPTTFWLLTFSFGLVAPGTGITLPGFGGEMLLDPVLGLGATVSGLGSSSLPLPIPNDPSFQGIEIFAQGFAATGAVVQFTNVTGVKFW